MGEMVAPTRGQVAHFLRDAGSGPSGIRPADAIQWSQTFLSEEAGPVQFLIDCPVDGPIEVTLEDIDTVVLREPECADIVFACPDCGAEIEVTVRIPAFLLSAIESLAEESGGYVAPVAGMVALSVEFEGPDVPPAERDEAYCEYFRRQLDSVSCVEDMLHEIDSER